MINVQQRAVTTRAVAALFGVTVVALLADLLFAQRVPLHSGFHWDGTYYIDYARNFSKIFSGSLDSYSLTRVLPSMLVHLGLRSLGLGFDDVTILYGFVVLNGLGVLLSLFAWSKISRLLGFTGVQLTLGAATLFINFCFLKYNSFYPVTTDVTAITLSLLMIWAYLTRTTIVLVILSVLGAFTWPTMLMLGAMLVAFPRHIRTTEEAVDEISPGWTSIARWAVPWAVGATALAAAGGAVGVWVSDYPVSGGAPALKSLLWLSVPILGGYLWFALTPLFAAWPELRTLWTNRWWYASHILLALGLVISVQLLIAWGATPQARNSLANFLAVTLSTATKMPALFLVAHFVFFGPIIALAVIKWRHACAWAKQLGIGYLGALTLTVLVAMGAESRQLMPHIAFIIVPVIAVLGSARRPWLGIAVFIAIAAAVSRVWVVMDEDKLLFLVDRYIEYPWQLFFGAIGYWMTFDLYIAHGVIFMATILVFWRLLGRNA